MHIHFIQISVIIVMLPFVSMLTEGKTLFIMGDKMIDHAPALSLSLSLW